VDETEINKKLLKRLQQLQIRFEIFQVLVEKELNRGNAIEAFGFYYGYTLHPLIEALRIYYTPYRPGFSYRYIHYDLPKDELAWLEPLFFVRDETELRAKWLLAGQKFTWAFERALEKVNANTVV
jgi:hypothetical protein